MGALRIAGLAAAALLAVGCYSPSIEECTITCGAGNACPDDTACADDGYCHLDMSFSCLARPDARVVDAPPVVIVDASDGPPRPDARSFDARPDAPLPPDARMIDARPPPDAALPDAPMPPPCTDELSAIEETDDELSSASSLSVTPDGHVHVTYVDLFTGNLRYAHRLPGEKAWHFETVAPAVDGLKGQALDSGGGVHVAYVDSLLGPRVMYAARGAASTSLWSTDVVDDTAVIAQHPTIAVDSGSRVHIAYWYNNSDLEYALRLVREGDWFITPIETNGTVGAYPSLEVGPDGALHASYRVGGARNDLGYAKRAAGASWWNTSRPDTVGDVGEHTSIDVDASGNAHIAYHDLSNDSLKYAFVPAEGTRRTMFADEDILVGEYTSIGVGADGTVHIAYYDHGNGDLKYARKRPTQAQFTPITLDGVGGDDVGRFASLDLDGFGGVHIAYIDDTFGDLRYAHICPR